MTTQTIYCQLNGNKGGAFTATCTDDAWNELLDANSQSLWKVLKGAEISQVLGSYDAGGAMVRVRNSVTNEVKMLEALAIVTEEQTIYVDPFEVEQDDILEAFCEAPPT